MCAYMCVRMYIHTHTHTEIQTPESTASQCHPQKHQKLYHSSFRYWVKVSFYFSKKKKFKKSLLFFFKKSLKVRFIHTIVGNMPDIPTKVKNVLYFLLKKHHC